MIDFAGLKTEKGNELNALRAQLAAVNAQRKGLIEAVAIRVGQYQMLEALESAANVKADAEKAV